MERRHICITVSGGLGDQVCAEPVIRWMCENFNANDDIKIMSQYPEIFTHLPVKVFTENVIFKENHMTIETHPKDCPFLNFHRMHTVDFISTLLFRRQLKAKEKTIQLTYPHECIEELKLLCGNLSDAVIVHPGLTWESRTIPPDFWNGVIKSIEKNHKIIVIGKNEPSRKDKTHFTGTVPLKLKKKHCDLRNKLSLKQLFCLIDLAPVLLTNDSAPTHIAGAFDNHIGLIPTCRHPDYILPWRHGRQDYKTKVLWKNDVTKYYDFDPMMWQDIPMHEIKFDWKEVLPDLNSVCAFVDNAF